MENKKVRVRFAPSPTGPLHIGGVRTALYNYLFAKKHNGDFILRIEDTDQNRFVPGAEAYIIESLKWCGIEPNEGVGFGDGACAPYRQSERKKIYHQYAEQLVQSGSAYYAFDPEDALNLLRKNAEASGSSFSYNGITRMQLVNSLTLTKEEVETRISSEENFVIRLKVPENEEVRVHDLIRGEVVVHTSQMDDKVLFKSDGMPTYHLANVVDDYLMKISHVIRGEEWLPSAPLHVLLYRYLGWENVMPQFAHLPLLLKPEGSGKLSKRDGDRLGFPVFPLQWHDPETKEISSGYREQGYFPEALVNVLALLGWHATEAKEIFSKDELIEAFSFERVNKSGARFDPEKTKWFNQQYLWMKSDEELAHLFSQHLKEKIKSEKENMGIANLEFRISNLEFLKTICRLLKEKVHFVSEFLNMGIYFFTAPEKYDEDVIEKKWNENTRNFFVALTDNFKSLNNFTHTEVEIIFKQTATQLAIKPGEVMQLFRVLLTGLAGGAALFEVAELLGKDETVKRLENALQKLK